MYGKIFDSMYDGTLYGHWQAIVTFQQMIVLADADGIVDMTPQAMAARTSIPLEIIQAGLPLLEAPDPYSRTPGEDGKRIELIDAHRPWGWHIVNHEKYKNLRDADEIRSQNRERQQRFRDKKRGEAENNAASQSVTPRNAKSRHTDTDTDTSKTLAPSGASLGLRFTKFWEAYPKKRSKGRAEKKFKAINPDEQLLSRMISAIERAKTSADWAKEDGQFIPHPATWLGDKGWENEDASAPSIKVDV